MSWTWLGIAAFVLLVCSGYIGYRRGFVKEVVSTFFVLLSIGVVWFINPYVNDFITQHTPVYEKVEEGLQNFVQSQGIGEVVSEQQNNLIETLALPDFLKSGLEENNTEEIYRYLAVDTFTGYVSGYLAKVIVNGLSFLVSFLLATVLIRMITYALDIIARLPIIKGVNKLAGACMGIIKFVIFLWIAFLVLTVFCNTDVCKAGLELIEKDTFLNFLYEKDVFVKIFMSIFY